MAGSQKAARRRQGRSVCAADEMTANSGTCLVAIPSAMEESISNSSFLYIIHENRKTEPITSEWCRCPANLMTVASGHFNEHGKNYFCQFEVQEAWKANSNLERGCEFRIWKKAWPSTSNICFFVVSRVSPSSHFLVSNGEINAALVKQPQVFKSVSIFISVSQKAGTSNRTLWRVSLGFNINY